MLETQQGTAHLQAGSSASNTQQNPQGFEQCKARVYSSRQKSTKQEPSGHNQINAYKLSFALIAGSLLGYTSCFIQWLTPSFMLALAKATCLISLIALAFSYGFNNNAFQYKLFDTKTKSVCLHCLRLTRDHAAQWFFVCLLSLALWRFMTVLWVQQQDWQFVHALASEQAIDLKVSFQIDSIISKSGPRQQFTAKLLAVDALKPLNVALGINEQSKDASFKAFDALNPRHWQGKQLIMSAYQQGKAERARLDSCQIWQATIRLKPISGSVNQAGFDYEQYAFSQQLMARAYVREWHQLEHDSSGLACNLRHGLRQRVKSWLSQTLADAPEAKAWLLALGIGDKTALSQSQWHLLQRSAMVHLFVISGLHIGLCASFVYLLFSGFFRLQIFLHRLARLWRGPCAIPHGLQTSQQLKRVVSVLLAVGLYALLAGFTLPVARAVFMLLVVLLLPLLGGRWSLGARLCFAMALTLLLWPLSLLQLGFYLSYLAVFVIVLSMQSQLKALRQPKPLGADTLAIKSEPCIQNGSAYHAQVKNSLPYLCLYVCHGAFRRQWPRIKRGLGLSVRLQFIIALALLPITYSLAFNTHILSPLVNLVALFVVGFVFVPALLCLMFMYVMSDMTYQVWGWLMRTTSLSNGQTFDPVSVMVLDAGLQRLGLSLQQFMYQVEQVLDQADLYVEAYFIYFEPLFLSDLYPIIALLILCLLLPKAISQYLNLYKVIACGVLFAAVLIGFLTYKPLGLLAFAQTMQKRADTPHSQQDALAQTGAFRLTVFDVGQGLALLIETANHRLLFDTAAKFDTRSVAQMTLQPAFYHRRIQHLDAMVVSHLDNDHAGGASFVNQQWPLIDVFSAEPSTLTAMLARPVSPCSPAQSWQWDGVQFSFIHPSAQAIAQQEGKAIKSKARNRLSCVLLVQGAEHSLLIPADIDAYTERRLLPSIKEQLARNGREHLDILVLAHHGSRYSSDPSFLQALKPQWAIASAGFLNRFKHPHPDVQARLKTIDSELFNTAKDGQLMFESKLNQTLLTRRLRNEQRHLPWRRQ